MAVVNTVLGTTLTRTVFRKPADPFREGTPIPRAIVNAHILDGVLDAKPVNDSQELQIGVVLDPKFAYRMVDFTVSAIQDVANDWLSRGYLEVQNGIRNLPAGSTHRHACALEDTRQNVTTTEMWIARRAGDPPRYIMQAIPGSLVVFNFFATNQAAAVGAAGTIDALFTFFEYEIEQAENWALHYSTLTYAR